jgi:hypothetical protein
LLLVLELLQAKSLLEVHRRRREGNCNIAIIVYCRFYSLQNLTTKCNKFSYNFFLFLHMKIWVWKLCEYWKNWYEAWILNWILLNTIYLYTELNIVVARMYLLEHTNFIVFKHFIK